MTGFLGNGWEDPKSSAIMALSAGLLNGNFGGGLLGANQAFAQAKQDGFKQRLLDAQYQETLAQAEERKQKLARAQQQAEFDRQFFGMGGAAAGPTASGASPAVAPAGVPGAPGSGFTAQQISQQFGVPMEAVIADYRFNGGKKIAELIAERSKPNWMNVNGNLVNTNQQGFQGGLQAGMSAGRDGQVTAWQPDGQGGVVVGAPQGAFETYGRYQGIAKGTEAAHSLEKVVGPDGAERFVPRSQVISAAQPQTAPRPAMRSNPADADRFAILTQELQRAQATGNAQDEAAIKAEISRLSPAARSAPSPSGLAVQGPFQATPTTAQALSKDAGGKINENWLQNSFQPVINRGDAARDLFDTVQVTRHAMEKLGGTGWSTQTKAAGAAILTGLGIAPKNAEMFAANAEIFQTKVMERVNAELNLAKGPQTDQDAVRAQKTWASLKNTTKANEFILDYAQAKAQIDQVRAKFYQQAMPVARQKGDLSEVDREWSKLAPSIFTMPSLKRWMEAK